MDSLGGMDALHEAIDGAWSDGSLQGDKTSEPVGQRDPMDAATDLLTFEVARSHGHEAQASRNGNTALAGLALEDHEDAEHGLAMEQAGVPEELWDNADWNAYVVAFDGDVGQAAEAWNANVDNMEAAELAEQAEMYDQVMGSYAEALAEGQLTADDLPDDVAYMLYDWLNDLDVQADEAAGAVMEDADQWRSAHEALELGNVVAENGGDVNAYVALLDQGYDPESAANFAMEIGRPAPGEGGSFDEAFAGLQRDMGFN